MLAMHCAHIVAASIALYAFTAFAQQLPIGTLTVVVKDQSGALVPGARIAATNDATGVRGNATTDTAGQSVVQLNQGVYDLKVTARGFKTWTEKNVDAKAETNRRITLLIGDTYSPTFIQEGPEIALDHQEFPAEIPLITMQQLAAPAKPLPRKSHWF